MQKEKCLCHTAQQYTNFKLLVYEMSSRARGGDIILVKITVNCTMDWT